MRSIAFALIAEAMIAAAVIARLWLPKGDANDWGGAATVVLIVCLYGIFADFGDRP